VSGPRYGRIALTALLAAGLVLILAFPETAARVWALLEAAR